MQSDLIALIQGARFEATRFRDGYDMEHVDRLLDEVSSVIGQLDPEELSALPQKITNARFAVTKFREGYDMMNVDDFLDVLVEQVQAVQLAEDPQTEQPGNSSASARELRADVPEHNKFSALNPLLETQFPTARTDGYSKKDVDAFVSFLGQLKSGSNTYTVAEALQVAEHLSPKPSGVFSKGYDRQHVDAFIARVVGLLRTL